MWQHAQHMRLFVPLLMCSAASVASEAAPPLNVLFILSDDLRPELSPYGQAAAVTPHLAALARRSLRFDRAFCQIAVCAPSRNSLWTGRRPDTSRVWNFIDFFRFDGASAPGAPASPSSAWTTLPGYFRRHGYTALGLGKTFHGCSAEIVPPWSTDNATLIDMGYCDLGGSWSTPNASAGVPRYLPFVLEHCPRNETFCRVPDAEEASIFDHNLTVAAGAALRTASALGKPWFIAVGYKKPHAPWGIPGRFFDQWPDAGALPVAAHPTAGDARRGGAPDVALIHDFDVRLGNGSAYAWGPRDAPLPRPVQQQLRRAYYAAVSFVDEQVGKLLGVLDALGQRNRTVVVFAADHGYLLGEHGEWEKKACFELTTRVPLFVSAPQFPASHGRSTRALTDLVDLFPTVVDLAGLPPPSAEPGLAADGVSALPLFAASVNSPTPAPPPRNASFSQYPRCEAPHGAAVEQGNCNSVDRRDFTHMGYSVRTAAWRYTAWMRWNGTRLGVDWGGAQVAEELYSHTGDDGTDFDAFENVNLLAPGSSRTPAVEAARVQLLGELMARFPQPAP